jgi:superfamily II DNA or RNA helicase
VKRVQTFSAESATISDPPQLLFRKLDLDPARSTKQTEPVAHQRDALKRLHAWYEKARKRGNGGAILVLPTGAGKTFTAVRFLARGPLSDGFKVLWVAHTHHLLEQALGSFRHDTLGDVSERRRELRLRVVSGTSGHYPPRAIDAKDDVVIATLQTMTHAVRENLDAVTKFVKAAGDRLFVIFDEAHHAPAPSYRALLQHMQGSGALALGLTATPIYSDEAKEPWLKKLFIDGIQAEARANELIAAGVLAKPIPEHLPTSFAPKFEGREFARWAATYQDIPEHIVEQLANNADRNALIAKTYADNRGKYKRTIIFTDRWYQCEAIAAELAKRKVRAGCVYSHKDASMPTPELRNLQKRSPSENAKVLEQFRRGDLEVLINVRMLTEGTDIPDAKTVFLTRQTTSRILLTQMVGRAMRGPKFGGTKEAYIVSFEDDWRKQIQWAGFSLADGEVGPDDGEKRTRLPLQLISIELLRRLAKHLEGTAEGLAPEFTTMLPIGWYRVQFDARAPGADDLESVDRLVMVYADERRGFETFVDEIARRVSDVFSDEEIVVDDHHDVLEGWRSRFLAGAARNETDLHVDLFHLARHVAQRGTRPKFFEFDSRDDHDLDSIARAYLKRRLDRVAEEQELLVEFAREDRFWKAMFTRYQQFKQAYNACVDRILAGPSSPPTPPGPVGTGDDGGLDDDEVPLEVKERVLLRDKRTCLACGSRRKPQVDHIVSKYHGGTNAFGNLQTLCGPCNRIKGTRTMNFLLEACPETERPKELPAVALPEPEEANNPDAWVGPLRKMLNLFYGASAFEGVEIAKRGVAYHNWTISLAQGNSLAWLKPFLPELLDEIQAVREEARMPRLASLRVTAPGQEPLIATDPD